MKLYEIKREYEDLLALAADKAAANGGEIPDDLSARMEAIGDQFEDKILNCALAYKNEQASADAIDAEIKNLTARKRAHAAKAAWLQGYIASCLPDGMKFQSPQASVGWRKSEAVDLYDPAALPDEFWVVKREPSKLEIKNALKSGQSVPGAGLVERNNITIK